MQLYQDLWPAFFRCSLDVDRPAGNITPLTGRGETDEAAAAELSNLSSSGGITASKVAQFARERASKRACTCSLRKHASYLVNTWRSNTLQLNARRSAAWQLTLDVVDLCRAFSGGG